MFNFYIYHITPTYLRKWPDHHLGDLCSPRLGSHFLSHCVAVGTTVQVQSEIVISMLLFSLSCLGRFSQLNRRVLLKKWLWFCVKCRAAFQMPACFVHTVLQRGALTEKHWYDINLWLQEMENDMIIFLWWLGCSLRCPKHWRNNKSYFIKLLNLQLES